MAKLLIYSPYSEWYLHSYYDITIAHAMIQRGHDVKVYACDSVYSDCDQHWQASAPRKHDSCKTCMKMTESIFFNSSLPFGWISNSITISDKAQVEKWVNKLKVNELFFAKLDGYPIAEWVSSSVNSHFRITDIDLSNTDIEKVFRSYLYSGGLAYKAAVNIINSYQPDAMFLFNGRMFSHRVFLEVAKENNVKILGHERGTIDNSLRVFENEPCSAFETFNCAWESWKRYPLTWKQLTEIDEVIFEDRVKGKNTGWLSYVSDSREIDQIRENFSIPENKKIINIFPSSDDEVSSLKEWKPVMSQIDWMQKTIEYFKNKLDYFVIVRLHPNLMGHTGSNKQFLEKIKDLDFQYSNVVFIWPKDKVNSYDLINASFANITFFSTITIECALRCKPVLICGGGPYYQRGFALSLESGLKLDEAIEGLLKSKIDIHQLRIAYRFAYHSFLRMSLPFPFVEVIKVHHARLAYNLSDLDEGKNQVLDRMCDFLINGKNVYAAPDNYFVSMDEEDVFLGKKIQSQNLLMNDKGLISVIVTCYNYAQYLVDSVESIINQSYENFELIIVNDGSTDNSIVVAENLIKKYSQYLIRLIDQPNSGQPAISRNNGIKQARGSYILCLDADDKLDKSMLKKCIDLLNENPNISIAYTDRLDFDGVDQVVVAGEYNLEKLKYENHISYCALYRREVWDAVGGYKENVRGCEDWDFWIAAGLKGFNGKRIPEPLLHYRRHDTGLFQHALANFREKKSQIILNNSSGYSDSEIRNAKAILGLTSRSISQLNSKSPLVSIILPTFNRLNLLKDALNSIKSQTYLQWEVIIVNEGDGDLEEFIKDILGDAKFKYIKHRCSFGLSAARNTGLRLSTGEIICFLDDDDLFLNFHLQTVVSFMLDKNAPVIYTDSDTVVEVLDGINRIEQSRGNPYKHEHYSNDNLLIQNYIPVNTWACRWECIQETGFFDETLKSFEDWDLLLRLSRYYKFLHINKTTVEVRRRFNTKDHMTDRERGTFPELYRKIYERTKDLETHEISIKRKRLLDSFEKNNQNHVSVSVKQNANQIVDPYKTWQKKHALVEADGQILAEQMRNWKFSPNFLILTVFESNNTALLADTIDSLNRQFYNQWSLAIISSKASPDPIFDELDMVHWLQVEDDPYQTLNQVLANIDAFDWVTLIPPGTVFSEKALSVISNYINKKTEWCFVYADEDFIDDKFAYINPLFKPDLNLELLRSTPYIGDSCFVRKSVLDEFGGYCGLAGVLNWDLSFKVFERLAASSIGHVPEILFHKPLASLSDVEHKYLVAAEKLTLQRHLDRSEIKAAVSEGLVQNTYFVDYPLDIQPLVSIVLTIVKVEQLNWLNECIETFTKNTEYSNYEIILTSKLPEADIFKVVYELKKLTISIRYEYFQGDLISPLSNKAIQNLKGDYILLFSPDLTVLHHHWLETLMAQGLRFDVGVVGARIVDSQKNVHHAGIVLGMGDFGVADYPNRNLPMNQPGYMNRAVVAQNFSAVSTQCFLVKKDLLIDIPLSNKANVFDHVEFCLNVSRKGYYIVWTPFVNLMLTHQVLLERSMDQLRSDADQIIKDWLPQLANDPAYNRNLSLKHRHFQIETETDVNWNVDFHDRPRVYAFPANESGIGEYRVRAPLRALTHAAMIESSLLPNHSATLIPDIVEIERVKPDTLLLQNGTADYLIHAWQHYRKFNDVFMIYSQDDLVHMLPGKHPLQANWPKDVRRRLSKLMAHSDRLIVATEPLQEAYSKYISDIKLVPNYLEKARWLDLKSNKQVRNGKKLRVGWAGGGQHHGDLEFIAPVIEATQDEVDWVFMGMCLDQIRPFIKEYHAGVAFDLYPQKLADLDLDLAIAPLEYNNFNMAKTNLRLLEYGVLGWPVLCSDITPYQGAPVTLVGNNVNHWAKAIREKIHEPEALLKEGKALQQWVLSNYMLEDHLDEWLAALTP